MFVEMVKKKMQNSNFQVSQKEKKENSRLSAGNQ
jgi:hypothetical protein